MAEGATQLSESSERFTGLASSYSSGRPSYPDKAVDFIINTCGLNPGSTLVDVGCGTGISSRIFAARQLSVIGVDPNNDMLQQATKEPALESWGQLRYVSGKASNTGLPAHCAEAVLAAQSFHWFATPEIISEFCRLLKPNGWIVLMWNERDEGDHPFTASYGELLRTFPETSKIETARLLAGDILLASSLVKNGSVHWFGNEQILNWDALLQRALSTSYAPKKFPEKENFHTELKRLYDQFQLDGQVTMHYKTSVYLAQPV